MNFRKILLRFSTHITRSNVSMFNTDTLSHKPLQNLLLEYVYFQCGKQKSVLAVIQALYSLPPTSPVVAFILKKTIFKHFCGGQTLDECLPLMNSLYQHHGISTILDYSSEDAYSEDQFQRNYENKLQLFHQLEKGYQMKPSADADNKLHDIVPFIPLKLTSLVSPSLLEKITTLVENHCLNTRDAESDLLAKFNFALTKQQMISFETAIIRLKKLCEKAKELQIRLLIDAEVSTRQRAVDCIWFLLALHYNRLEGASTSSSSSSVLLSPVIYNTYQCYLKKSKERIQEDYHFCQENGLAFGVKLVRGAYMRTEGALAKTLERDSPVFETKEQTDYNYNDATEFLFKKISENSLAFDSAPRRNDVFVLFATHNRESLSLVLETMERHGVSKSFPAVHFAQILGMTDNLTYGLGKGGYNVSKLILYGKFDALMPWMLRRLEENQDSLGGLLLESNVIKDAIRSRLRSTAG
jgi:hypothetical protein